MTRTAQLLRLAHDVHRRNDGLLVDLALYGVSAVYAGLTAAASTLPAHRIWGSIAVYGYLGLFVVALAQLLLRRVVPVVARPAVRMVVVFGGWTATTLTPLVIEAAARANGALGNAQEEVSVVEQAGARFVDTGSPYLTHDAIAAALPSLGYLAYVPYNPGIAVFGLARRYYGDSWWTDARVGFAVVTAIALIASLYLLRRMAGGTVLVRAAQAVTVLPVCALTLATGGDDLPVLTLTLLAFTLAARAMDKPLPTGGADPTPRGIAGPAGWWLMAGLVAGDAGALKFFAWPAMVILGVLVVARARHLAATYLVPAFGVPVLILLPIVMRDPDGVMENLVRYPLGEGMAATPAASNLPGHLLAVWIPQGDTLAAGLLAAVGLVFLVHLVARPPASAGGAAWRAAVAMLLAILLAPATRFGYLLYPAAYAVWATALVRPRPAATAKASETREVQVAAHTEPA